MRGKRKKKTPRSRRTLVADQRNEVEPARIVTVAGIIRPGQQGACLWVQQRAINNTAISTFTSSSRVVESENNAKENKPKGTGGHF